jgi:cation:H+ antiporter
MEEYILELLSHVPLPLLFVIIAVNLYVLAKSADVLVDKAVTLSVKWGVPKVLIGATIISLGTTLPEAAVSVFAAVTGRPGLALGNAVGSIICDTGLILGLAVLIGPVPINKIIVRKQNLIQIGAALALVIASLPFTSFSEIFTAGGRLPQFIGFIFLLLLVIYIWRSISWSRNTESYISDNEVIQVDTAKTGIVVLKLIAGIAGVVLSSRILIPTVQETAMRLHIPESIIAATLVAFGTSLPELVTAVTAVRKKHGEIALGNVIGADILNVLFVAGAAASVTPGGLKAPPNFFVLLFPAMLLILLVCRGGLWLSKDTIAKPVGVILILIYVATIVLSYFIPGAGEFL